MNLMKFARVSSIDLETLWMGQVSPGVSRNTAQQSLLRAEADMGLRRNGGHADATTALKREIEDDETDCHDRQDCAACGTVLRRRASRRLYFMSGQIELDPISGKLIAGDVAAQTEQILRNINAVLDAAGKSFADVVKTNVFLTNMKDFAAMNAVYERHFEAPLPARTTIAAAALPLGAAVEIEVVAA